MANKLQIVAIGDGKEHRFADPYQVDKENRLYLNGVYIAWYSQTDETSMTYEALCDLVEGLKMALPGLVVEERHTNENALPKGWTLDDLEEHIGFGEKAYLIEVVRIAYSQKTIPVRATSKKKAKEVALGVAGDHEFNPHHAEYMVEGVAEA